MRLRGCVICAVLLRTGDGSGIVSEAGNSQGKDRRPMNLIRGVRSACAAACRRALVASIVVSWLVGLDRWESCEVGSSSAVGETRSWMREISKGARVLVDESTDNALGDSDGV